jgi:hypothetical protein
MRHNKPGMCLWHVQDWCAAPHLYPGAWNQWEAATHRHPGDWNPPAGVPVFFSGGRWGHIALSIGHGRCRSTDAGGRGVVADRPLSWFASAWGRPYAGWSEDIGGVLIPHGSGAPDPHDDPHDDPPATIRRMSMLIGHSQHNAKQKILVGPTSARVIKKLSTYQDLVAAGVPDTGKVIRDETIRELSDTGSAAGGVAAPGVDKKRGPG